MVEPTKKTSNHDPNKKKLAGGLIQPIWKNMSPNWDRHSPQVGRGEILKNALSCPPARITSWFYLQHLEKCSDPPTLTASSSFGAKGASGAAGASHIPYHHPGRWDTDGRFLRVKIDDGSPSRACFPKNAGIFSHCQCELVDVCSKKKVIPTKNRDLWLWKPISPLLIQVV